MERNTYTAGNPVQEGKELRLNSDHVSSQKVENKSDNRGENGLVPFLSTPSQHRRTANKP